MKKLFIGDPHVLVNEIEDCERLFDLVEKVIMEHSGTDAVVITGDLFHNHSLVHVEVMKFWNDRFTRLQARDIKVIAMPGNHDMPGISDSKAHALLPFKNMINVCDSPTLFDNVLYMPFMLDKNEFIKTANLFNVNTLVCHQTFNGAKYGGFEVPEGIDLDALNCKSIISGHIHTEQTFGKVYYIGSPRWRTLQDANINKYIWIIEFDSEGNILSKSPISTEDTCKKIRFLTDAYENELEDVFVGKNEEVRIDIKGPRDWVESRKKKYDSNIKLRIFYTDRNNVEVRESEGIGVAFKKYLDNFKLTTGIDKQELYNLVNQLEI
jgi:DNA repair exonuclease SbcCD nuclease subunit